MLDNLSKYQIVLGSASPRRKALLKGLGLDCEVRSVGDIDESYPKTLQSAEVPLFIATKKAEAFLSTLSPNELLITADTVVCIDHQVIGKPVDASEAFNMLKGLSGHWHEVITGVCVCTTKQTKKFSVVSKVKFSNLTDDEITYYINHYHPLDKAGSYGIQEWIGFIGVESIEGSFYNVMGLPVQRLYQELKTF